ncbi:MAG: NAD-dependent epimerase/dehydratase family protein [Leptolyngbya sp. SIO1E4]|nr:NAD-dependent epimerase/dehydratase family protein [Leptolyngbya sp. SIO1E4]
MAEKVLVCGGAGFIGSSLAIGLRGYHVDWEVTCLDNLKRRGSELNLTRLKESGIQFIHGDIRCRSDLDPQVLDADIIIDCSAEPSVLAGFSSPDYVLHTNLVGTINILELARKTNAKLLFLSTSRVYPIEKLKAISLVESETRYTIAPKQILTGFSECGVSESFSLQGYRSLYGTTKLASELLIEEYRQAYGLKAIINRCGVVTGPWQMGKVDQGVFVLWVAAHHFGKSLQYIGYGGSGKQVRDLLHIDDLLELVEYQITHFELLDGDVLNVGGGINCSLSLLETTQLCQSITKQTIEIVPVAAERSGDVPLFIIDDAKIREKTGWSPKHTPETSIADIYHWLVTHETLLKGILA